jgi:hypothetical protein
MKHSAHVEQALAEYDAGERLGSLDAMLAAEKRLAAAGHIRKAAAEVEAEESAEPARTAPPRGRTTRQGAKGATA